MGIKIWVITSTNYAKLLGEFAERFEKFWGEPFSVYVSNTDINHWSDGIMDFLKSINDEYLILLSEDFYLTKFVNKELIEKLKELAVRSGADRVSLLGNHTPERTGIFYPDMCKHLPEAEYQFSLEASIQKKEFLLKYLKSGYDPWETERIRAKTARGSIYSSIEPAIWYEDKSRQLKIQ